MKSFVLLNRGRVFLAVVLLLIASCGILVQTIMDRSRPLFYEWGGWAHPSWDLEPVVRDQWGNSCFFDRKTNMVVVVSGKPNEGMHAPRSTPYKAIFRLFDSDVSFTVDLRQDTLVIITPSGAQASFGLNSGAAHRLQRSLVQLLSIEHTPEPWMLEEIVKRYDGPDEAQLKTFVGTQEKGRGKEGAERKKGQDR